MVTPGRQRGIRQVPMREAATSEQPGISMSHRLHIRLRPTAMALAVAGVAASPAVVAQSGEAPTELDTVVVTANKREQKQREVAGNVSVLQGAELEEANALTQADAFKLQPGVQVNQGNPNNNTVSVRGLTSLAATEGGGLQQGPTGFYLGDVPLNSPIGKGLIFDIYTFDLARIELLRGPQGVLYSSGALGGAVRYLYAQPDLQATAASVIGGVTTLTAGGTGYQLAGMVNLPLADGTVGVRAVGFFTDQPGYVDNLGTGTRDANSYTLGGGRVIVGFRPNAQFNATLTVSSQTTNQDDVSWVAPDPNSLTHSQPTNATQKSTLSFSSLEMNYDFGPTTLTSITGYYRKKTSGQGDDTQLFQSLGIPAPLVARPFNGTDSAWSQELRIANNPGTGPLTWLAGLFYQSASGDATAQQNTPGFQLFPGAPETLVDTNTTLGGTEAAVFGYGEYAFGNGWAAGLGGRYYRTTSQYNSQDVIFGAPNLTNPPDGSDSGFLPKIVAKYQFGDNMAYGLVTKGYRYGGVNGLPPYKPYTSDNLWNYETGLRLQPLSNLKVDLTAFYLDWRDAQFTYFDTSLPIPVSAIGNVGQARSIGLEGALNWRVNSMFNLLWIFAYTDAKTTEPVTVPSGTIPSGSRLPGTATWQTALTGSMNFSGPWDSFGRAWATYTYNGSRAMDLEGLYSAPAYNTLDLGVSMTRERWTGSLLLGNTFNEKGISSITGTPGGGFAQYYMIRPRNFTLLLRYDF